MAKIVFNPFTGNFDWVVSALSEVDDVDISVAPTKGSLLAGDGSLWQELGIGSNGQVLLADSTQTLGVRWSTSVPGSDDLRSAVGAYTVPATVVVGNIVYATGVYTADIAEDDSIGKLPAMGVVIEKPTSTTATVLYYGEADVFAGLTAGVRYFVASGGGITTTPPTGIGRYIQSVGVAVDSDTLVFSPGMIIGL